MARPEQQMPRRSIRTFALLAALMALLGVAATGCGTEDEDPKEDATEQTEGEDAAATDGEDAATDEEAAGEDAATDGEAADEGDDAAADEEKDGASDEDA